MFTKYLISETIPAVSVDETAKKVLENMQQHDVSELPVVESNKLIGLVSKSDISDLRDLNQPLKKYDLFFNNVFVTTEQIFLDAMSSVAKLKLSIIPVVNNDNLYEGSISTKDLLAFFVNFSGTSDRGGLIVLEMNINDYV